MQISDVFVPFLHRLRSDAEICISTMQMQSASFCIKSASDLVPVHLLQSYMLSVLYLCLSLAQPAPNMGEKPQRSA